MSSTVFNLFYFALAFVKCSFSAADIFIMESSYVPLFSMKRGNPCTADDDNKLRRYREKKDIVTCVFIMEKKETCKRKEKRPSSLKF